MTGWILGLNTWAKRAYPNNWLGNHSYLVEIKTKPGRKSFVGRQNINTYHYINSSNSKFTGFLQGIIIHLSPFLAQLSSHLGPQYLGLALGPGNYLLFSAQWPSSRGTMELFLLSQTTNVQYAPFFLPHILGLNTSLDSSIILWNFHFALLSQFMFAGKGWGMRFRKDSKVQMGLFEKKNEREFIIFTKMAQRCISLAVQRSVILCTPHCQESSLTYSSLLSMWGLIWGFYGL